MNLLLMLGLAFFIQVNDTNYIKIHVVIEGQPVNTVSLTVPFNGVVSPIYPTERDKAVTGGNNFDLRVPFDGSAFFTIWINDEAKQPIALNTNDSISIFAERTVKSGSVDYNISISGSNALAHTIYQERFFPPGKNYGFFEKMTKKAKNYSGFYIQSKKYIDSLTLVWDSLKQRNLISKEIYDLYAADTKASLYYEAIKKLSKVNVKDSSYKSYTKWLNTKQVMFSHANAFNPLLLKTYTGSFLYEFYLQNILKEDDDVSDSVLKKSDIGYFYYYDTAYREWAWGSYLYSVQRRFPSLIYRDSNNIEIYKKYYPGSRFLKLINQFHDSIINERKILRVPIKIDSSDYASMNELLAKIDARYIFIDVWATWCIPCLQEFDYLSRLTKFMSERNIAQIALSLDKRTDVVKWGNFINSNYIPGHHFIISEKVQTELLKILSQKDEDNALFIPRYLLYDKQTDKYYIDLPRPGSGIVLESVIDDILKK